MASEPRRTIDFVTVHILFEVHGTRHASILANETEFQLFQNAIRCRVLRVGLNDDSLEVEAREVSTDRLPKELGAGPGFPQIGAPEVQMRTRLVAPLDLVDAGMSDQLTIDDPRQKKPLTKRIPFGEVVVAPCMIEPFGAGRQSGSIDTHPQHHFVGEVMEVIDHPEVVVGRFEWPYADARGSHGNTITVPSTVTVSSGPVCTHWRTPRTITMTEPD